MTPLQIALAALKSVKMRSGGMQSLDEHQTEQVRAVIIALAECDLPSNTITDGSNKISLEGGEYWKEKAELCFRTMLRSIASSKGEENE